MRGDSWARYYREPYKPVVTFPYNIILYKHVVIDGHTQTSILKSTRINARLDADLVTFESIVREYQAIAKTDSNNDLFSKWILRSVNVNPDARYIEKWKLVNHIKSGYTMYSIVVERAGLEQE